MALVADGRVEDALGLIDQLAANGNAEAFWARGLWRLEGRLLPRDPARARDDFRAGDTAGHVGAARIHAGLLASGTGGARDWRAAIDCLARWADRDPVAARQRALIAAMPLDAAGEPTALPEPIIVNITPYIARLPALLSAEECAFLAEMAEPRLKPALIFHEGERRFIADPVRDSDAAGFPLVFEWPTIHALNRRFAAVSGTDITSGETLQVLRYRPGQQYRAHLDAIPGMANQRHLTLLTWLNDAYEGGETLFTELCIAERGRTGDALLFANALPDGRPDPATRHVGSPVTSGIKLLASRWIRQRPPDDPLIGFGQHDAPRA